MSAGDAFDSYATLTIGDGLVFNPGTDHFSRGWNSCDKASGESKLSIDLQNQIFSNVQALYVVAAVLFAFALIPGLPVVPFMLLAIVTFFAQASKRNNERFATEEQEAEQLRIQQEISEEPRHCFTAAHRYPWAGTGIWSDSSVDEEQDRELLKRIKAIRRQIAMDYGYIVPPFTSRTIWSYLRRILYYHQGY